jgi:dipeptidyl aminopeptidase/acylaminoacyl peptidase
VNGSLRRYTPELAVDLRMPLDLRLSPDGSAVAFQLAPVGHKETERTASIHVVPTDGSASPRAVTDSEHDNTAPRWSPDGRSIAFLSDRPKRGEPQLHRVPADGGEPLRLTDLTGGVANPSWSPDGRLLFFTARRRSLAGAAEPEGDVKVYSERWRPRAIAAIPATGGAPTLVGPSEGHVWTFAPSPDGTQIAALVSPTEDLAGTWDNVRLVTFAVDGSGERELLRLNSTPVTISWSPDGHLIAVVGTLAADPGDQRVFVVDVTRATVAALDPRDMTPEWAAFQGDDLLVMSVQGQRTRLDRTDPLGSEWEQVDLGSDVGDGWFGTMAGIDAGPHGLAFDAARSDRPPDIFVTPAGGAASRLSDLNPQLDGVAFGEMRALSWQGADGLEVESWLVLPPGEHGDRPLPLVVHVHGGPTWQWGNWFHGTWHDYAQVLAARGFAVLLPNPRGSTGRGGRFTNANRLDFGGHDFDDVMRGVDVLIERGVADPRRLGIGGWSFGGFMTAWAITHTDRFKAAVAGAAPTNWVSKIGTTDIGPYNEWNLGQVHREPDRVWERSPIRYLSSVATPTLILHGEADKRVPVGQGLELYLGLRAAGVETELITYPRQEHSFHERAHQLDLLQRVIGWYERFL